MDAIVAGKHPTYPLAELEVSADRISETDFRAGNAFCKTILCLLAYQLPKSFDTNGVVILDNSNLKIATSRNYHHFFPKKYLEERVQGSIPNLIANITLIDGCSNKHKIGKKSPKFYISAFAKGNKKIAQTLKSHLIDDREPSDSSTSATSSLAASVAPAAQGNTATVTIERTTSNAEVYLDGAFVGNTPAVLHPSLGNYVVRLIAGKDAWERTLAVSDGADLRLRPAL